MTETTENNQKSENTQQILSKLLEKGYLHKEEFAKFMKIDKSTLANYYWKGEMPLPKRKFLTKTKYIIKAEDFWKWYD